MGTLLHSFLCIVLHVHGHGFIVVTFSSFIFMAVESEIKYEPRHEISNIVECATSKGSDQPAHTRSLIRAFASRFNII